MKKYIKSIMILMVTSTVLYSCKKDFLNLVPLGQVPESSTWSDGPLAEAFVNGLYQGLNQGGFREEMLSSFSDESIFTHAGRGFNIVNEGTLNPSNTGWGNGNYQWNNMYQSIRPTLIAMTNLPASKFDASLRDRLRGEAMFLYAYYNHQILRYYGGGPLINKIYGLDEDYSADRATWAANVDNIVKYCDSAVLMLTGKSVQKGRPSATAALALKARVLLYAASDLHDMPTAKAKSTVINGFAKPELLGYVSGARPARWTLAKNAAKAVLDATKGYKLDLASRETDTGVATKNYISMAMGGGSKAAGVDATAATEILFGRYFIAAKGEEGRQIGLNNGPNGYNNWAGNTPIQQLVDDYEMMDGTKFDWNNPTHKAAPFVGREPRFYAHILYDGSKWKPRGSADPANEIQAGQYQGTGGTTIYGLDTRQSSIENWNGSWTGYYGRKFIDPNPALNDNKDRQDIPWPFIRYTEVLLNYAEACIELGEDAEARTWLNKIRFRAGLPALTESGDALRQRYRNERRIELAYEEHRWSDARRWMIAPTTLGRKTTYMVVRGVLKPGQTPPIPYRKDETKYTYTYTPTVDNSLENRNWLDKMYFLPISRDEINRNKKLVQNPGYE